MTLRRCWLVVAAMFLTIGAGPPASDSDPASYSLRLPLTPVGTAPVQRFVVPLEALIALQSADMSDVRVFDANGRVVPISRLPDRPQPSQAVTVSAQPILGSNSALDVPGVSLKLDDRGRVQIISIDGKIVNENKTTNTVGALFDTRGQTGDAQQLVVTTIIPAGQPVTLTIDASEDLKTWRLLGERVVYRPPDAGNVSRDETIALEGTLLGNTQLRATWRADSALLAPVVMRQAVLTSQSVVIGTTRTVLAKAPPLVDAFTIEFAVPFATSILTIAIDATGNEGLLPIRILGRKNSEAPWALVGQGNAQANAAAIALSGQASQMMRIEADSRTSGFTAPPSIRFALAAREIAFVTSGTTPFTFAAGHPSARDVFLPLDSLTRGALNALPMANIRDSAVSLLALAPVRDDSASRRALTLWAILLAVTALLGGIAWYLWSSRGAGASAAGQS